MHEKVRSVFQKSLKFARQSRYLKGRKISAVPDTSNILGRGAVKDTYDLLSDGIVLLVRVLAVLQASGPEEWARAHEQSRYFGPTSTKREAEIDWEDPKSRHRFLTSIVADTDRLLENARQALTNYAPDSIEYKCLTEAAELLSSA